MAPWISSVSRLTALPLVAAALVLSAAPAVRAQQSPFGLTHQQLALLSASSPAAVEAMLGPSQAGQFESTHVVYDDPRLDRIAARLQRACPRKGLRVRAVRDGSINAVTYMGGNIYVNSGMLAATEGDDDMLAAVVGHEMGHAGRYHTGSMIAQRLTAHLLARKLMPHNTPVQVKELLATIGFTSFTRDSEREADNDSLRFIAAAGFDVDGVFRMMKLLETVDPQMNPYLRSHPPSRDRGSRLREFAAREGYAGKTAGTADGARPAARAATFPTAPQGPGSEAASSLRGAVPSRPEGESTLSIRFTGNRSGGIHARISVDGEELATPKTLRDRVTSYRISPGSHVLQIEPWVNQPLGAPYVYGPLRVQFEATPGGTTEFRCELWKQAYLHSGLYDPNKK